MTAILDQAGDLNYQDLNRFADLYEFPQYAREFLKSAEATSATAADKNIFAPEDSLPLTVFADPAHRQFPCHTKAACYFSSLYFTEKESEVPLKWRKTIREKLASAAGYWGISTDLAALSEKHASLYRDRTNELPDSSFAYVYSEGGEKTRHLPLRNGLEVKVAAEWLQQYRDELPFGDRHRIAGKILDKVAEYGVALGGVLDDWLEKQAGRGMFDPAYVAGVIRDRVTAANHKAMTPEIKEGMLKLASSIEEHPELAFDMAAAAEIAEQIDTFDHVVGLAGKYANKIPRVEEAMFAISYKEARAALADSCTTLTGFVYHADQFSKLALAEVQAVMGDDVAEAVAEGLLVSPTKMAEIAPTLPLPDAQALDRLMAEAGEAPYAKQAMAYGLSHAERTELAALTR